MLRGKMKTVRVSLGSAVRLGLKKVRITCLPTTIYLMTSGVCAAKCLFCSQWVSGDQLSRIQWLEYPIEDVISRIGAERVCIQCLNYEGVFQDLLDLTDALKNKIISVSAQPFTEEEISDLKNRIDRISINLDCATPDLFRKIKPYYTWEDHVSKLLHARAVFGPFRASSHLIVGLGECEEDMVKMMRFLYENEISSSLFAFTPIEGTPLEKKKKPSLTYYRRMQIAHYLTYTGKGHFTFHEGKVLSLCTDVLPEAFTTRGCPGCNRPYYTETPRHVYNFPSTPDEKEMELIRNQLNPEEYEHSL